jgi:hypothetical protein
VRTIGVLILVALSSALLFALAGAVLAAATLLFGGGLAVLSLALTARRWGRPVRRLRSEGPLTIRRLLREKRRFATLRGTIVEGSAPVRSPVSDREAAAWRLKVTRGPLVDWAGHDGRELRLSDTTGIAAVDLPSWLVFSGEAAPERFSQAGSTAEHALRAHFGKRAERWLSDPRYRYVETLFVPGRSIVVFGKVTSFGNRPRLSPRAIAVDDRPESLVDELGRRSRRAWLLAAALAALLGAATYGLHQADVLPLERTTWEKAAAEYEKLLGR